MADLLIRDIDAALKRWIEENARRNRHSISDEAKDMLTKARASNHGPRRLGTEMVNLVPECHRGDDLEFEVDEPVRAPPDLT